MQVYSVLFRIPLIAIVLLLTPLVKHGSAQEGGVSLKRQFNLPELELDAALDAYAHISGVEVFYESSTTAKRRSKPVNGLYTPEEALRLLLQGSNLQALYTTRTALTIVPIARQFQRSTTQKELPAALNPSVLHKYNTYLAGLQADVLDGLCRDSLARPGRYAMTIRFWIDPVGKIERTAILEASGQGNIDAAVLQTLGKLTLSEPPPLDLPQPISMRIRPNEEKRTKACE